MEHKEVIRLSQLPSTFAHESAFNTNPKSTTHAETVHGNDYEYNFKKKSRINKRKLLTEG